MKFCESSRFLKKETRKLEKCAGLLCNRKKRMWDVNSLLKREIKLNIFFQSRNVSSQKKNKDIIEMIIF